MLKAKEEEEAELERQELEKLETKQKGSGVVPEKRKVMKKEKKG